MLLDPRPKALANLNDVPRSMARVPWAPTFNGWVFARSTAPEAWQTRPETGFQARLSKLFVINYIYYSPPPLTG